MFIFCDVKGPRCDNDARPVGWGATSSCFPPIGKRLGAAWLPLTAWRKRVEGKEGDIYRFLLLFRGFTLDYRLKSANVSSDSVVCLGRELMGWVKLQRWLT